MRLIDADALIANEDLLIVIGAGDNICIDIADIAKAPAVDAVDRQKLIGVLFPLGVPLTREDWNYSINAKAVYEAIMRTEG